MHRHGKKPGEGDRGQMKTGVGGIKKRNATGNKVREIAWGKTLRVFQGKDTESELKVRYVSKIK